MWSLMQAGLHYLLLVPVPLQSRCNFAASSRELHVHDEGQALNGGCVYVLGHEIRSILMTGDLLQPQLSALDPLLQPEQLDIDMSDLPDSATIADAARSCAVGHERDAHLHAQVLA